MTGWGQDGPLAASAGDENILAGGAPFYRTYLSADGKQFAVAAVEPHFYKLLLELVGALVTWVEDQLETTNWPERSRALAAIFAAGTRDEWSAILDGTDACSAPVLELEEAARHPQAVARGSFFERGGILQIALARRFSRTPGAIAAPRTSDALLRDWGVGS